MGGGSLGAFFSWIGDYNTLAVIINYACSSSPLGKKNYNTLQPTNLNQLQLKLQCTRTTLHRLLKLAYRNDDTNLHLHSLVYTDVLVNCEG